MLNYKFFLVLICVFLLSCSQATHIQVQNDTYPDSFSVQQELLKTDTLRIHLPKNRPQNMSIMTPSGEWFIVQSEADSIETISQNAFNSLKVIEFKISTLKGVTWRDGKRVSDHVFSAAGQYLIYFADNLETEPENTFSFSQVINVR